MQRFEEFKKELETCLEVISEQIGKLGTVLLNAREKLLSSEYDKLEMFLLDRGLTRSDIKAAKAVAEEKLDGRLFFAGVASSKLLSLSPVDQSRLLSGEKFNLMSPGRETVYQKSWGEMFPPERNQLMGPKGGGLRSASEQVVASSSRSEVVEIFDDVTYRDDNLELLSSRGKRGKIQLGALACALDKNGEFDAFIADLVAVHKQQKLVA